MIVTIYTSPTCPQCKLTERMMTDLDIPFEIRNVVEDHTAHQIVTSLGYRQVPVVITDTDHWSGFRPDKIDELAASLALSETAR